jgi:hypothetical protein
LTNTHGSEIKNQAEWVRLGTPFMPMGQFGWMNSHAQVPTPLFIDGVLRVYFSTRPRPDFSLTTYVDLDPEDPMRVLYLCSEPLLQPGGPGSFDEFGIMPSCAIKHNGKVLLYYSGWTRGVNAPYHNTTGLAVSTDSGRSFKNAFPGPVMDRTHLEPFSATSPFVIKEKEIWHAFYSSGTHWLQVGDKLEHTYDIKHAISLDGIVWDRKGQASIPQHNPSEAITRPFILKVPSGYAMWYCFRGSKNFRDGLDSYRIGFAFSKNLNRWNRLDEETELFPPPTPGSTMQAYPALIEFKNDFLFFFNENGFGKNGFTLVRIPKQNLYQRIESNAGITS